MDFANEFLGVLGRVGIYASPIHFTASWVSATRLALAGEVIQIMVELFKIADQLPDKNLPRYLPELESFRTICRMHGKDIFEAGRRLYSDRAIWQAMPDGAVIMEKPISKATLRGSLKNRLQDVAHEFGFKFSVSD